MSPVKSTNMKLQNENISFSNVNGQTRVSRYMRGHDQSKQTVEPGGKQLITEHNFIKGIPLILSEQLERTH